MAKRDIVVIGASAGGIEALRQLIRNLPPSLPASLFVVNHFPPHLQSRLDEILAREGTIACSMANDGAGIERNLLYIARPGYHLLLREDSMALIHGPRENRHIPAIDPLFRSAAAAFGSRVIGILLSGSLDDGVAGMEAISMAGGLTMVQDPSEAIFPDMPINAMRQIAIHHCLPAAGLAGMLATQVNDPAPPGPALLPGILKEVELAGGGLISAEAMKTLGDASSFICPECGGALWTVRDTGMDRYRCHVGHAYTAEALQSAQAREVEKSIWFALRTLEDRHKLYHEMTHSHKSRDIPITRAEYGRKASEALEHAAILRGLLSRWNEEKETP